MVNYAGILFYNVENLFDTSNDPQIFDDDFSPEGKFRWTKQRLENKILNLSAVIEAADYSGLPALIGLAEVENDKVLDLLVQSHRLKKANYQFVHVDSTDERGMDVCLLYRADIFQCTAYELLEVEFDFDYRDKTRGILYVRGRLMGEVVHLFVNHWPSRGEGQRQSEPKRIVAASVLREKINAVKEEDQRANIIIMGDFNDYPGDKSIVYTLKALDPEKNDSDLYNLAAPLHNQGQGSYFHRGKWGMLDQFMVSANFLSEENNLITSIKDLKIVKREWMLYEDYKSGELKSNKTYAGTKYIGGYSDHLPIYLKVSKLR